MIDSAKIRKLKASDLPFIYSTWLRSLYYGNEFFGLIGKKVFFDKYKLVLYSLVADNEVQVCCDVQDEDVILGYAVYTPDRLHWVYVKESWRRLGVAKSLVPDSITSYSHFTETSRRLTPRGWEFDPFL